MNKAYDHFIKKDMNEEAKALQTAILNKSWTSERIREAGID